MKISKSRFLKHDRKDQSVIILQSFIQIFVSRFCHDLILTPLPNSSGRRNSRVHKTKGVLSKNSQYHKYPPSLAITFKWYQIYEHSTPPT